MTTNMATVKSPANQQLPIDLYRIPVNKGTNSKLGVDKIQSTFSKTDTSGTGTKCPSYRESNKGSKERQGPTLSVRFTEVSVL